MLNRALLSYSLIFGLFLGIASVMAFSRVIEDGENTFIVDQHGERWDISQAQTPHLH